MQLDGRQCADWLGKELAGGLAEPTVGAGHGSTSGGTKKVIVEQLGTTLEEKCCSRHLDAKMYQLLPYSLQHVPCSLLEIDNMSGLCRGGPEGSQVTIWAR